MPSATNHTDIKWNIQITLQDIEGFHHDIFTEEADSSVIV